MDEAQAAIEAKPTVRILREKHAEAILEIRDDFGDLSILMSPRGLLHWAQGSAIFGGLLAAVDYTFLNRLHRDERALAEEMLQALGLRAD